MTGRWAAVAGGTILACFVSVTRLEHFTREGTQFIPLLLIAFAAYGIVCWRVIRDPAVPIGLIMVCAVLFRLPLLTTPPTLSTDVWRYLWDGRLVTHGINPYEDRVDSPELADLRTDLHPRIEHQWMASPYPPAAQTVFALVYALFPENHAAMQMIFTFFDLLTAVVLVQLLHLLDRPSAWVLIYAWNPLIVVEFAHGAHIDSLMTLLILLAVYFLLQRQTTKSAMMLAFATLAKFIPALLLPVFIWRWGIKNTLLYGLIVGVAFLPFLSAGISHNGTGIFGAAGIYAREWKTNDGLFYWLVAGLAALSSNPIHMARLITMLILVVGMAIVFVRGWRGQTRRTVPTENTLIVEMIFLISLYLLLVSAMFPWYLTWLIALLSLLPLNQNRAARWWVLGWLYFSAAVNLSYLFYLDPANPGEQLWIRLVEYVPLYILLGISGLYVALPVLFQRLHQREQQHEGTTEREQARIEGN